MRNRVYSDYLSYRLTREGHEVRITDNGLCALNEMKATPWDLVLIGILIEYYNGLEVIAAYRAFCDTLPQEEKARYTATRMMVVTRVRSEQAQKNARNLGVSDYYTLPLKTSLLMTKIRLTALLLLCLFLPAKAQERKNGLLSAGVNYYIEHVAEPARLNWQIVSAEAAWGVAPSDSGFKATWVSRLNVGQRTGNGVSFFHHTALQGQVDAYLRFTEKVNLTVGYGYSASGRFPSHQALAELSYALGKGWGVNGGLQLTNWDKTAVAYQLGVEKYAGPFWLTLKPMVVVQSGEPFMAVRGSLRYYHTGQTDNYLNLGMYYGNSPEFANYLPDLKELLSLGSWGIYTGWQQKAGAHFLLRFGLSYRREEYRDRAWRNVIGANAGLTYKF